MFPMASFAYRSERLSSDVSGHAFSLKISKNEKFRAEDNYRRSGWLPSCENEWCCANQKAYSSSSLSSRISSRLDEIKALKKYTSIFSKILDSN